MKLKYYLIILFLFLLSVIALTHSVYAKNLGAKAEKTMVLNYYYGRNGFKRNYFKAVYWFRKAAEQGNAEAQLNIGMAYWIGKGVKQNYSKAVYWLKKAAAHGNREAKTLLNKIERR